MAGMLNGCAAVIQREYLKALYCHCNSHALNLCVMAISAIALVSNMWTMLQQVSFFFENSPKRQQKLTAVIQTTPSDAIHDSRKLKLVSLCKTRWVQRHTAPVSFSNLYPAVVTTLEDIANDRAQWKADSCSAASSLLRAITDFSFISAFTITANIMAYVQSLSSSLQEKALDVCQAYSQIDATRASLN
eukprot:scpid81215/ scgid12363/ 52 kDa repressor of the inhibitor of the protein kinase; 58 kDa interferon-induced protein kinase-interacting protein; Death-associated protein 4; THAP domain-containing protein 0